MVPFRFGILSSFVVVLCLATMGQAQEFNTLITFNGANGANPVDTSVLQGVNGEFYGVTEAGGGNSQGTIFRLSSRGQMNTIYNFCMVSNCTDGSYPVGGLVLGNDGNFYGTTSRGGSEGLGTVYRITSTSVLTQLHSFVDSDGTLLISPLIQATDGALYGTTGNGGANGSGTFFKITLSGTFTVLYNFTDVGSNGPLLQASDGNFYGTSEAGGTDNDGIVFKLTPTGAFSVLHSFEYTDGQYPACGLVQGADGYLYGTTYAGGANSYGTAFKISLKGNLTTLHNFDSSDGANPIAAMILATDGNFYGTTYGGGASGLGTIYEMTPAGALTVLHSFDGLDGSQPYGPLNQATNGSFYGTATYATNSDGTAFELETGLGPFVKLVQPARRVGQMVGIIGQGFVGTSSVTINGISTAFMIRSANYIAATVPTGATTGFVTVTTDTGTLQSNVPLVIVP